MTDFSENTDLDARGLKCPLPVLKLRKRLKSLKDGDELSILTDDPAAVIDVPFYCTESGNTLLDQIDHGDMIQFRVRKGG